MHETVVTVDELESGEDVPGFAAKANVTVAYVDHQEFVLTDVEIKVWRNGGFVMEAASEELAEAIRNEITADKSWVRYVEEAIASDIADRDHLARDRHYVMERV